MMRVDRTPARVSRFAKEAPRPLKGALVPIRYAADDLTRCLPGSVEDGLVLVDLVYREAHRCIGLPLAHDLDEGGDTALLAGPDGPLEGVLYLLGPPDPAAQSPHSL